MRTAKVIAIAGLALFGLQANAKASSITYTESATVSGSLKGVSFTNELLTLTGTGDTTTVTCSVAGCFNPLTVSFTLAINGPGTVVESGTFAGPTQVVNVPLLAGFEAGNSFILGTSSAVFNSYALSTSIGPIIGVPDFSPSSTFATSAGDFNIQLVLFNEVSFTAIVTPLPAALPLFATGLGALGLFGWRRKRKTQAA